MSSLAAIIDMVKVLAFTVKEGRVAVHCHAGLGRTGRNKHTTVHKHHAVQVYSVYLPVCVYCVLRRPDRLLLGLHPAHHPK